MRRAPLGEERRGRGDEREAQLETFFIFFIFSLHSLSLKKRKYKFSLALQYRSQFFSLSLSR